MDIDFFLDLRRLPLEAESSLAIGLALGLRLVEGQKAGTGSASTTGPIIGAVQSSPLIGAVAQG